MEPERITMPGVFSQALSSRKPETCETVRGTGTGRSIFSILLLYSALIATSYLGTCAFPRLLDQIDGQYAGAAREMISDHRWLVPTQNGIPRLRKPPLTYWLEVISFKTLGANEFAARLPICLATLGWFIVTALLAYECTRDQLTSLASSVILATFFGTFQFSHLVMPEPVFGLLITCCFWLLVRLAKKGNPIRPSSPELIFLWIAMALGVLCKGIHGLLLPIGVLITASIFRPGLRPLCKQIIRSSLGWAIFAGLVFPWYLLIEHRYPGFILDQLGNEQVNMLIGRRWPVDGGHLPLLGFWAEQLAVLFPWTFLIPGAVVSSYRFLKTNQPFSPEALILTLWLFIYAAAITFANLQDYYLLICLPVIAIWLAWSLNEALSPIFTSILPGAFLILIGAGGIILGSQPIATVFHPTKTGLASETPVTSVATALVNLGGTTNRSLAIALTAFGVCAILTGIAMIALGRRRQIALLLLPPFVVIICLLGLSEEVALQNYLSSASLAYIINRSSDAGTLVVSKGNISDRTSLYFYLRRKLCWFDGDPNQEYATRRLATGKNLYLNVEDLRKAWNSSQKVYLIVDHSSLTSTVKELGMKPDQLRVVTATPTDVVMENR